MRSLYSALYTATIASAAMALALIAPACDKKPAPAPAASQATSAGPEGPAPENAPASENAPAPEAAAADDDSVVVARFAQTEITAEELKQALRERSKRSPVPPNDFMAKRVLDQLINGPLVAAHIKGLGFAPDAAAKGRGRNKQVANYLDGILRKEAEAAWRDSDIEPAFVERRELRAIVVPTRPQASKIQIQILDAIGAAPETGAKIFNDFALGTAKELGVRAYKKSRPFNSDGVTLTGEEEVPFTFAKAVFALKAVGDVTPPVPVRDAADEVDSWAILQLRRIRPAKSAAERTPAMVAKAKQRIIRIDVARRRDALVKRLRAEASVVIDAARLATAVKELNGVRPKGPKPMNLHKWRRGRLRGLPERVPGLGANDSSLKEMSDEEVLRRMQDHIPSKASE